MNLTRIVKAFMDTHRESEIDKIHVENLRKLVETYVRKLLNIKVNIAIKPAKRTVGNLEYIVYYINDTSIEITYKIYDYICDEKENNVFKHKLAIVEGLSNAVICAYRQCHPEKIVYSVEKDNRNDITYFSIRLLESYAVMENGAILRSRVVNTIDEINKEVVKYRPDYALEKVEYRDKIDELIRHIFTHPKGIVLRCEMQDAEKYLPINHKELEHNFKVVLEGNVKNLMRPFALCYYEHKNNGYHLKIEHNEVDFIKNWVKNKYFDLAPDEVEKKILCVIRILIAHELAHAILHLKPGVQESEVYSPEVEAEVEAEATFLSLILICWREWHYSRKIKDIADGDREFMRIYAIWCNEYKDYYKKWGDKWIEKVVSFDVMELIKIFKSITNKDND